MKNMLLHNQSILVAFFCEVMAMKNVMQSGGVNSNFGMDHPCVALL
jgi:hypothetical protein